MSEQYEVKLTKGAAKEVAGYEAEIRRQIDGRLEDLRTNPRPHDSRSLRGLAMTFRVDIGEYRILYDIDYASRRLLVWRVRHRKDAYKNL